MNDKMKQAEKAEEEIEGLGETGDEDASLGDYPIDTFLIRNENRTIHDVLRRMEQGSFVMNPDFQRDFLWREDKQSKLVESILMRIPLPVFYLAEDEEGRMIVVDGLQRLTTFKRFVGNEFSLKLPEQKELDQKVFSDLSPKLQNRFEDCNLILYIIDSKVPERARMDIFDRVNGGVPLNRQQMRNCLWHGKVQTPQYRVHFSHPIKKNEPVYVVYVGPRINRLKQSPWDPTSPTVLLIDWQLTGESPVMEMNRLNEAVDCPSKNFARKNFNNHF